jgi:hypothetical protein
VTQPEPTNEPPFRETRPRTERIARVIPGDPVYVVNVATYDSKYGRHGTVLDYWGHGHPVHHAGLDLGRTCIVDWGPGSEDYGPAAPHGLVSELFLRRVTDDA